MFDRVHDASRAKFPVVTLLSQRFADRVAVFDLQVDVTNYVENEACVAYMIEESNVRNVLNDIKAELAST